MISEYIELIESFKANQFSVLLGTIQTKVLQTLKSGHFNPRLAPFLENMNPEGVPFTNFDLDPENVSQIKKLINALYYARQSFLDLEKMDIKDVSKSWDNFSLVYGHTIHQAYQASYLITHLDVDIQEIFKDELALILPAFSKLKAFAGTYSKDTLDIVESLSTYPVAYRVGEVSGRVVDQMQPDPSDWNYEVLTSFSALLPGYIQKLTSIIEDYSTQIKSKEPTLNNEKLAEIQAAALKLLNDLENTKSSGIFVPLKVLNYIHIVRNIITLSTNALEQMGNFSNSSQDVIRDRLAQLKYDMLPTLFGLVDKIEDHAMLKPGTFSIPLMNQIKPLYAWLIHYASKPVNFKEKGEELLSIEDSRFLELRLENTYKRIDIANKALFKIQKVQVAFDEFFSILNQPQYSKLAIHDLPNEVRQTLITHYKLLSPYMQELDVDFNALVVNSFLNGESTRSKFGKPVRWIRGQVPSDHASAVLAHRDALQNLITKKRETHLFHIHLNEDLIHSVHRQTELTLFPYSGKGNVFAIDEATALSKDEIEKSSLQFKQEDGFNVLANPENLSSDQALELHQWYKNKHNKFVVASRAYFEFMEIIRPISIALDGTKVNILNLSALDEPTQEKCKRLYNVFQPYFMSGAPQELKKYTQEFDKQFVRALNKDEKMLKVPLVNLFEQLDMHFQVQFTRIDLSWARINKKYLKIAEDKFKIENDAKSLALEVNTENRAHYVLKHTRFSKLAHDLRKELNSVSELFNETMKDEMRFPEVTPVVTIGQDTTQPESNGTETPQPQQVGAPRRIWNTLYNFVKNSGSKKPVETPQPNVDTVPDLPKGIPYPELENKDKELAQPKQAVALKRIWNSLYHVEKIIAELEKLNNKHTETRYVYHLLQAYDHLNEIKHLVTELSKDPHFKLIGADIIDRIQWIIATAQEQTYSYQVDPTEVPSNGKEVQNNTLWYTLNAFYILPQHIRSLRNDNYLTTDELQRLHVRAKQANITIENIIKSSDSYFKLFMQSPAMFSLYREMTKKLHEFLSTSHDTVMNNLDQFHAKVFTPMLIEADAWENRLCLKPGLISGPLKQITDEYYKGLLHPLRLPSKDHIQMACDMTPVNTRIRKTQKQIQQATAHINELDNNYKHIILLHVLLAKHKHNFEAKSAFMPTVLEVVSVPQIIEEYKKAMYKLNGLKSKLPAVKGAPLYNQELDSLLNADLEEYDPHLSNIYDLVNSSYHHYLGLKNTYSMKWNTAVEKLAYLKQLRTKQEIENLQYIEAYTVEAFNNQVEAICNQHIGLQYTYEEFNTKLRNHLLTFKDDIVNNAKSAEDIDFIVKKLLKEKTTLFKNIHFAQFEHLDKIEVVLGQFRTYFDKSQKAIEKGDSVFESVETLRFKTKRINALDAISKDKNLSVQQRIDQIADKVVKDVNFERVMLITDVKEPFSFAQIKKLLVQLLELLFYTPERKSLLNKLNETIKTPVSPITSRLGMFSSTKALLTMPSEKELPPNPEATSSTPLVV